MMESWGNGDIQEDIEYFKRKVEAAKTEEEKDKALRQLALLEDAIVIYKLSRG